jgi:hypothetical protein
VQSVKVIFAIHDSARYYYDSKKWELHFTFCRDVFGYPKSHADFNREQYSASPQRRYYCASINYYKASSIYTLEFVAGDQVTAEQISLVWNRVLRTVFFHGTLRFMPTSQTIEAGARALGGRILITTQDEIFAGQNYQPLNEGETYGYLTRIPVESIADTRLGRRMIVLTNGVPNDIPVVAGIITTDFQTPLAHINVLSRNRGTPNMALRNGWADTTLRFLEGKLVYLHVTLDSFSICQASLNEAELFWLKKEPSTPVSLACNDSTPGLCDIRDLDHASISLAGAKAANFGELARISVSGSAPIPLPEGAFAMPFYYYRSHCAAYGIDSMIERMLSDLEFQTDLGKREHMLAQVRDTIESSKLDAALLSAVEAKIRSLSSYTSMRFRSSTNAEDLDEFNGAGLYGSFTGKLGDPSRSIESAVKKVWASLWNIRSVDERDYFRIDQRTVAMGILVHRSFPDELANGVAITKNIYNENLWGLTVNVQRGEVSVVDPPQGVISDQLIFYTMYENPFDTPVIEYLSHSSLTGGKPVLSEEHITELALHLSLIKTWFYLYVYKGWQLTPYPSFAMDVEFKFDAPGGKLYIKQARPYR